MKKTEKTALKLLKKGFTINEWENFQDEIKQNDLILSEVSKKIENYNDNRIQELTLNNPFLIKHLSNKTQLKLVTNENFKYLSENLQLQISQKNNNKLKYASDDVQIKFATNNPVKLSFLDINLQKQMIENNPFYLEYALEDIQIEYAKKDSNMLCRCSNMVQCSFIKLNPNYYLNCNFEVKKNLITLNNLSCNNISVETLEMYLSCHYEDLSLEELDNYKNKIELSNRDDKDQLINYIQYLQINLAKKKIQQF